MGTSTRGFTLVELLVSMAVMLVILATSLFRFNTFDSEILLKTLSYDVALSVRQAQSYSLNVLGTSGTFDSPYGVSFTPGSKNYPLFLYGGSETRPRYDGDASVLDMYQLSRRFEVVDVCVVRSSTEYCDIDRLDVSFRRPEFTALFYAEGYSEVQNAQIESASIDIQSSEGGPVGTIEVGYTGYITVTLE
ncbi:prepilin-type N-terminal cleavage/methylation domain-containing protein [Candidatus Kaiserbacteria bacterium]|nr:prepilin-type N-terminal cleavage/methylation domain-containing protein [Candidatus Kaiserbacteria bacterium]